MVGNTIVDALEAGVWLLTPITELVVVAVLTRFRLWRSFGVFGFYLSADVVRSGVLWWLGRSPYSSEYKIAWVWTEPCFLIIQFFLVLELFRLLYEAYPGIRTFARILTAGAISIALLLTFGTFNLDVGRISWIVPSIQALFVAKRAMSSMLGTILLVTMIFFPKAPSARRVLMHGWLLTCMFLVAAIGFFAINLGYETQWMGTLFLSAQLLFFVLWAFGFARDTISPIEPGGEEIRRVQQWNRDLMRIARWIRAD